jgi:hypothetical protein
MRVPAATDTSIPVFIDGRPGQIHEFGELALQVVDDPVAFATPRTARLCHAEKIGKTRERQGEHLSTG